MILTPISKLLSTEGLSNCSSNNQRPSNMALQTTSKLHWPDPGLVIGFKTSNNRKVSRMTWSFTLQSPPKDSNALQISGIICAPRSTNFSSMLPTVPQAAEPFHSSALKGRTTPKGSATVQCCFNHGFKLPTGWLSQLPVPGTAVNPRSTPFPFRFFTST